MKNIKNLGEKWTWSSINPKLAGIGVPKDIINDLLHGSYKAFVKPAAVKRAEAEDNIYKRNESKVYEFDGQENLVENALSWEALIPVGEYGAGSLPVINFTENDLKSVEKKLTNVAKSIYERYALRFTKSPLLEAAKEAFTISEDFFENSAEEKLKSVISKIPGPNKDQFDIDTTLPGYKLFI